MCVHCYPDQLLVFLPRAGLRGSAACWRRNTSLALQQVQVFDFPSWTISSFSFLYLTFPALLSLLQRLPDSALARWQVRQTQFSQNCLQASLLCWAGPIVLDSVAAPARHSPYLAGRSPHRTCQERVSEVFYDRVGYVIRILSCKALRHVCML